MPLRLYMDHHVPWSITEGLRLRGIDVLTCYEDGAAELEDERLLQRASELDRVLFSQGADLLALAKAWQQSGRDFAGLFYGHQLHLTIGQAVRDLELAVGVLAPDEIRNKVEYLPL